MRLTRRKRATISDINITPIVDVMLMLLVIFILTAPSIRYGLEIGLPKETLQKRQTGQAVIVSLRKDGQVFVQEKMVNLSDIGVVLSKSLASSPSAPVMLAADRGIDYGRVMALLSSIRRSGIDDVYLLTEPSDER